MSLERWWPTLNNVAMPALPGQVAEEGVKRLSRVGKLGGITSPGRAPKDKEFPTALRNALARGTEQPSRGYPLV